MTYNPPPFPEPSASSPTPPPMTPPSNPYTYPPQAPYPPAGYQPYPYPTQPQDKSLGVVALILGLASFVLMLGPLAGIPAVILGMKARKTNKQDGMAMAGIVLGWISIVLTALFVLLFVLILIMAAASDATITQVDPGY